MFGLLSWYHDELYNGIIEEKHGRKKHHKALHLTHCQSHFLPEPRGMSDMIDNPAYISESIIKMIVIQLSGAWNAKIQIWDFLLFHTLLNSQQPSMANDKGCHSCYTPFKINARSIISIIPINTTNTYEDNNKYLTK